MEKLIVSPGFVKKIEDEQDTQDQAITSNSTAIAKVQNGLAYIVGNINTTGSTLAVGQFVYVKGHSTIAEGLRKVTASISANGNITTSNTSACSDGGLNALNSKINDLIKSDTFTGTTTTAGILYAGVARNRIIVFADCPNNSIINLDYPIGSTNFLVYSTDGTKLNPVINTSVTVKYWYYEISGSI